MYVLRSLTRAVTYVGITKDVEQRLSQHNGLVPGGAKSTRGHRPWSLEVTLGPFGTRGYAQSVEYRIKQLPAARRLSVRAQDYADEGPAAAPRPSDAPTKPSPESAG